MTLPKAPRPSTLMISKSLREIFAAGAGAGAGAPLVATCVPAAAFAAASLAFACVFLSM